MAASPAFGGGLGIIASAAISFLSFQYRTTIYECISGLLVSIIGILALIGIPTYILVPVSYLLFGLMWSTTIFLKAPLTACWGALYLVTPIWTYFLLMAKDPFILVIINTITPALHGLFTK
jgi:hypothetical protein